MLCPACKDVLDKTPLGVLTRDRDDEDGTDPDTPRICKMCQRYIWRNNNQVRDGHCSFVFENPNANGVPSTENCSMMSICPAYHQAGSISPPRRKAYRAWLCKCCGGRVWSTPRAFEGGVEPEDWWWCRSCQKTQEKKKSRSRKRSACSMASSDTDKTRDIRPFFGSSAHPTQKTIDLV
jgi:hypothetical protein